MTMIEIEQTTRYQAGHLLLEEHAAGYRLCVGEDTVALSFDDLAILCALVNRAAEIDAAADARAAAGEDGYVEDRPVTAADVRAARAAAAAGPVSRIGIKDWARAHGWEVHERGRVPAAAVAAFDAAHGIAS
jgi:hypothetical protein